MRNNINIEKEKEMTKEELYERKELLGLYRKNTDSKFNRYLSEDKPFSFSKYVELVLCWEGLADEYVLKYPNQIRYNSVIEKLAISVN